MNSGVYEILNTVNGKRYIGSATNFKSRWRTHRKQLSSGEHHSVVLQRAWDKYGSVAFVFAPVLICAKEDLIMYEQRCFDGYKPEYNVCPRAGSSLGVTHPPEFGAKIRARQQGRKTQPCSEETKAKIGSANRGRLVGIPQTPEHIAMRIAGSKGKLRGRTCAPADVEKRASALRGVKHSAEANAAKSLRMMGNTRNLGKKRGPLSETTKRAISDAKKRSTP